MSRGRRSGTTWRHASSHASLTRAQGTGCQVLRSSSPIRPRSFKRREPSRRSRNRGPQTCLPTACDVAQMGSSAAHLHQPKLKTLARGQASRDGRHEASSRAASSGRLTRRRRDQGRGTSRGARDASHDDRDQAGAGLHSVLVSPLMQRGQAQAKASGKGYHSGSTRPRPTGRHDRGHHRAQDGMTTRAFGSRRPTLVRISVLDVPLQNGQLLAPFLLNIWEEAQGFPL